MKLALFLVIAAASLITKTVEAQSPPRSEAAAAAEARGEARGEIRGTSLAGGWTYRSYRNDPTLIGDDANKALALLFAEAVFKFEIADGATLRGTIDWTGGGLDLNGTVRLTGEGGAPVVEIVGTGRPGTSTAGWEYDYNAQLAYHWPTGVDQVPALVGTVMRAKAHDGGAAGYVASFIAVKQP